MMENNRLFNALLNCPIKYTFLNEMINKEDEKRRMEENEKNIAEAMKRMLERAANVPTKTETMSIRSINDFMEKIQYDVLDLDMPSNIEIIYNPKDEEKIKEMTGEYENYAGDNCLLYISKLTYTPFDSMEPGKYVIRTVEEDKK